MRLEENNSHYNLLRDTFTKFVFEDFEYGFGADNTCTIRFIFKLQSLNGDFDETFTPTSVLHIPKGLKVTAESEILRPLIFQIGMAELVSYWKVACPKEVEIKPFTLSNKSVDWWKNVYHNGLQEFYYLNCITQPPLDGFMHMASAATAAEYAKPHISNMDNGNLIPVGGGKDSAVTVEAFKSLSANNRGFIINPRGASEMTLKIAGHPSDEVFIIKRRIDARLLEINDKGFKNGMKGLNGHTPFSATLAFYSILAAYFCNVANIVLSNESSANEATVVGTNVNHQYSKTYGFEQMFRDYIAENISEQFNYYSFLRPLNELQIAKLFSEAPQYFKDFKSCNKGSKEDKWCLECPKCLFTYIILSPFVKPGEMEAIFGKNLFDDLSLTPIFRELTGDEESKPFECVGTVDEVNSSIAATIQKHYSHAEKLPALLAYYTSLPNKNMKVLLDNYNALLHEFNEENFLPEAQAKYLKARVLGAMPKMKLDA